MGVVRWVGLLPYGPQHVGLLVKEAVVSGVVGCNTSSRVMGLGGDH